MNLIQNLSNLLQDSTNMSKIGAKGPPEIREKQKANCFLLFGVFSSHFFANLADILAIWAQILGGLEKAWGNKGVRKTF